MCRPSRMHMVGACLLVSRIGALCVVARAEVALLALDVLLRGVEHG